MLISSNKKRSNGRKSKNLRTKNTKLQKVQERNSILEEEEKTEFEDDKNTI